jgi:hypothetical protein
MLICLMLFVMTTLVRRVGARHAITNFDTHGHLYFSQLVRQQGSGPFGKLQIAIQGMPPHASPVLWHWLLSFIPHRILERFHPWLPPVSEGVFVASCHALCLASGFPEDIAWVACALYVFTPLWFSRLAIGPRVNSLTPRLASELCVNLYFIILLLPLELSSWVRVPMAVALGSFTLLSSKFGAQALVFLSIPAGLLTLEPTLFAALCGSFALSLAVSRGQFRSILMQQVQHLGWYAKKNAGGEMPISSRNSARGLVTAIRSARVTGEKDALLLALLSTNSYTAVALKAPLVPALGFAMLAAPPVFEQQSPWAGPFLAACLVYLLVNRPRFLFLGEAERYLNHVAFLAALGAASTLNAAVTAVLLGYGLVYWALESFWLHRALAMERDAQTVEEDARQVLRALDADRAGSVICCPDHTVGIWRIMARGYQTVHPHFLPPKGRNEFEERYGSSPYPNVSLSKLDQMALDLGVTHVILYRSDWLERGLPGGEHLVNWERVDAGGQSFYVFRNPTVATRPRVRLRLVNSPDDLRTVEKHLDVFIYGAGKAARAIRLCLAKAGLEVRGFITTDSEGQVDGLSISRLDDHVRCVTRPHQIVVASQYWLEISHLLSDRGIVEFFVGTALLWQPAMEQLEAPSGERH